VPGVSKKLGRGGEGLTRRGRGEQEGGGVNEKGEGVNRKGERVESKRITCSQSQTFHRTSFAHEQGAIVQSDWLVAHQSKHEQKFDIYE